MLNHIKFLRHVVDVLQDFHLLGEKLRKLRIRGKRQAVKSAWYVDSAAGVCFFSQLQVD